MFHRFASLRFRLVIAFLLVSVPPMLAATYVATRLIASAFEDNVEQWLGETTKYLLLQVRDNQIEAGRLAQLLAKRVPGTHVLDQGDHTALDSELELACATGCDLIAIYDSQRKLRFASQPFMSPARLPLAEQDILMDVRQAEARKLLAGATRSFTDHGETFYVLVGSWVDDESLGGIKIVSSLDLRLYTRDADRLVPVFVTSGTTKDAQALPKTIIDRLIEREDSVYDDNEDSATYRAVYAGLRNSEGQLVAVIFCGLARQESFFPRIGGWELFVGMFALGSLLSVLVGLWMSGLLVRPLKALSAGVRSVTAGDYQQRVAVAGGAEVEDLATSFNSMAAQLSTLKTLEADLRRNDRLKALGEAAMVIAHEVRNPLGIIQTSAELVRSKARLAPAEDKLLGYVVDEVRRIEGLIREFLDFAHPKPPQHVMLQPRAILEKSAAFAASELEKRGIAFVIEDHAPGAAVSGDPDQLYQAVLNLVLNAMDAMPKGGQITGRLSREGQQLHLTIADTGQGVPKNVESRLFEPFFTTKAKGSGLGLAKVRTVAEAHSGSASYAPATGAGSAFTIALPMA